MESSSSNNTSEDEVNFVQHLDRPRVVRIHRNRTNQFTKWDDMEFYRRFRLSKNVVNIILERLRERLESPTNR